MARLIDAGVPAADAAQGALSGVEAPVPNEPRSPESSAAVARLIAYARNLDPAGLSRELHDAFAGVTSHTAVEETILPFVRAMGDAWELGEVTMVYEHFASELVGAALLSRLDAIPPPPADAPAVVVACPADERHVLGNIALWLLLAEQGLNVIYLGADLPTLELVIACRERKPAAVCLTATASTSLPTLNLAIRALIEAKAGGRLFVGGPALAGERDERPIAGEHLPHSLTDAAHHLAAELLQQHNS